MNILWKVENVIINFYIRKWGRKIKQTALNIEHGPHVKRIVSRIMGELTEERGRNEKRDDNPSSWIFLLLCRDGKVKSVCLMTIRVEARDHYGRLVSVGVCVCVIQNKSQQNVLHSMCLILALTGICSRFMYHVEQERNQSGSKNSHETLKGHLIHPFRPQWLWILQLCCLCALELQHVLHTYCMLRKSTPSYKASTTSAWCLPDYSVFSPPRLGFFNAYLHQNQIYCRVGFHIQVICCGVQYMRVSGPVCILLCYPVMSGEVYKKNRWSLAQTKVEIKRSYSFSLGWYSSKEWNAL